MAVRLLVVAVLAVGSVAGSAEPRDAEILANLAVQKRDAARKTYEATWANYRDRRISDEFLYRWSTRWLDAEKAVSDKPADRVAALQAHFGRMVDLEKLVERIQRINQATIDEVSAARFYRVEAEIWLLQAKQARP